MLLEMHCHTSEHSSCSHVCALELVQQVFAKGLQGVVLTDHHYLWPLREIEELRRRARVPDHFLILSGQEVHTRELGDVLVFGATERFRRGTTLKRIRSRQPEAALVWAHPYRKGNLPDDGELTHPLLDAVEIFNSNQTVRENSRGLVDWHRLRFTALAGTDTHGPTYAGLYPTLFDHPFRDINELAREIRGGRCRPFLKEIPRAGAHSTVTEVTIGAKGADEVRPRIILRTLDSESSWRSAERAHHILESLAGCGFDGGRFRIPRPIDEDPASRTLIQEGLRGKSLHDKLLAVPPTDAPCFVELAARWLARLHACRLKLTPAAEFLDVERKRLARYVERFVSIGHPFARRVEEIAEVVGAGEMELGGKETLLVQGHGDYHPKNIFIGQDRQDDPATLFVAAIDFESSLCLPPAFDVGTFLAQFRNQLFTHPPILAACPEALFLTAYLDELGETPEGFRRQVELFRARACLSIAAYLFKVGLGGSEDLHRVLIEAERALTGDWLPGDWLPPGGLSP